jgi:hypothetical protein
MNTDIPILIIILSYILSVIAFFAGVRIERKGIALIICWLFLAVAVLLSLGYGGIPSYGDRLVYGVRILLLVGIISFGVSLIAGLIALLQKGWFAVIIAFTYLVVALYTLFIWPMTLTNR